MTEDCVTPVLKETCLDTNYEPYRVCCPQIVDEIGEACYFAIVDDFEAHNKCTDIVAPRAAMNFYGCTA